MSTDAQDTIAQGGPNQSLANRQEELVAAWLLERVEEALTDRNGGLHAFPWTPSQRVRIGVLGPHYPPPAATVTGGGSSAATGTTAPTTSTAVATSTSTPHLALVAQPVDNRGTIGVDFVVARGASDIPLTIEVDYAIYHSEIPAFSEVAREAQTRAAAAGANPRRRPTVPVNPSWRRDNQHVVYTVQVPTDTGDHPVLSADAPSDPFVASARNAVTAHFASPDALWKLSNNQTLPVADALADEARFRQALAARRDPGWQPQWPMPQLTISTMPTVDGDIAVSVSMTNEAVVSDRSNAQDLGIYDTRMRVVVDKPARLLPQQLSFADDDLRYRHAATVAGRGRGCVAVGEGPATALAETLPTYVQRVAQPTTHGVTLSFRGLASEHVSKLTAIAGAMRAFLRSWDFGDAVGTELDQLADLRRQFEAETERFELGCDLLQQDERLRSAFTWTNRAFADARGRSEGWRLFQLVFIVTELGALAAREDTDDPVLRGELDAVDVLWFPTGGGKTEAYLGLILVALFFDRLRGKLRGTTAWLLFPLRMLSVQQLARVSNILERADVIRAAEDLPGDPFALGYLVGANNTPNRLASPNNNWWPGLSAFSRWSEEDRNQRRLVGACPTCGEQNSVCLEADVAGARLLHVCRECSYVLKIYASDEEVTRYQPAVVVSTVDKITSFSFNGQLTSFNRGPRKHCPAHGWYTHSRCVVPDCSTDPATHGNPDGFFDPTPALWIQDELHLVREDLGVFASHYQTLVAELAKGAGHEPSKVIAATATIEQYELQLSQVYGRRPRMFPVGGPTLARSFYNELVDDVRRIYVGVLPAGGGLAKVDVGGQVTVQLVREVHELMDDPSPMMSMLSKHGIEIDSAAVRHQLLDYELALAYVNTKAHGVTILNELTSLSDDLLELGQDRLRAEYLMGETSLGDLASVVAEVQRDPTLTIRADRIRALVGTSVVSHGVDLDRLNLEVLAGMPPTYAMYIQAASRSGRSHVGLVISVFDRNNRRETSMFQSFLTTHAALERMVEPVPVNRFAARAVQRTLPGIVCALLWDETRNPAWGTLQEISMTRHFSAWWNAQGATLTPHLQERIAAAYRCPVRMGELAAEEDKLVADALHRWNHVERQRMQNWQAEWLTELFTVAAMNSLRDVQKPVEFSGGRNAGQVIARLYADQGGAEDSEEGA